MSGARDTDRGVGGLLWKVRRLRSCRQVSPSLHQALGLQSSDVVEGVAEPGEDVGGVLAEARRDAADAGAAAVPLDRQADRAVVGQARDAGRRPASRWPRSAAPAARWSIVWIGAPGTPAARRRSSRSAVLSARVRADTASTSSARWRTREGLSAKRGSASELGCVERLGEPHEQRVGGGADHHVAVGGGERLVGRDHRRARALRLRHLARCPGSPSRGTRPTSARSRRARW